MAYLQVLSFFYSPEEETSTSVSTTGIPPPKPCPAAASSGTPSGTSDLFNKELETVTA